MAGRQRGELFHALAVEGTGADQDCTNGSLGYEYRQVGIYAGRILKMLWGGSGEHISIAALTNPMEPHPRLLKSEVTLHRA
jgi:hypothetical protein